MVVDAGVGHLGITGFFMTFKMRDDDRRAVDLLMNRPATAAERSHGPLIYPSTDARLRERVARVEKMLGVLENMPATDPPADLLERTLRHVAKSTGRRLSRGRHGHAGDYRQHPMA